ARGTVRAIASDDPLTKGALIITNDRWNSSTSWVGVIPVRESVEPYEVPYSVQLDNRLFATAGRIGALVAAPHQRSRLGAVEVVLTPKELARCEDALCHFLQIPLLLGPAVRLPPVLGQPDYPLWGEIYYAEPPINDELKRYIVVSPNSWNAVSGTASLVRTTSQMKYDSELFPPIQNGAARACCGEATTVRHGMLRFGSRVRRPAPMTTTRPDMARIARAFLVTHGLDASARRMGILLTGTHP
ncbi:MAG: hypothetical protein Q7S46_08330, partial [Gallionella sp.]|nr:hypothetical protein [Gallionella sp.]